MPHEGYYSLIQFCPNASRFECANLGVVLFCPALSFLDAKLAPTGDRAKRFFGRDIDAAEALDAAYSAIAHRLESDRESFQTVEDLQKFIDTRANDVVLSPLRPMRVESPESQLEQLLHELVLEEPKRRRAERKLVIPQLDTAFRHLAEQGRATLGYRTRLPLLGQLFHAPYAYRNGVLNLVTPERFAGNERDATEKAMKLAIKGDQLDRHGEDEDGRKRLVIVADFPPTPDREERRDRILGLLEDYPVKAVTVEEIPAFVEQVMQEAHR